MEQPAVDRGSIAGNAGHIQNTAGSIADTAVVVGTTVLKSPQQPGRQLEAGNLGWPADWGPVQVYWML